MSLKHGDLKGTILPKLSIDEYEPKAGDRQDVIVVAFYADDEGPANDLNTFIQRGSIDTLDVEVSDSTDDDGNYLVFVEMNRNDTFPNKLQALIKDIENVTSQQDWSCVTYLGGDVEFQFNDPDLYNYVMLNPDEYITKDEFSMKSIDEAVYDFFKDSYLSELTLVGKSITLKGNNSTIIAEVVDVGSYDTVISRNYLTESAFKVDRITQESKVLKSVLGNYQIAPIGDYFCIGNENNILLLANTEIKYGR